MIGELENPENNEVKDLVFRLERTYNYIVEILDAKNFVAMTTGSTLATAIFYICDLKLTLKSLLPNKVKINFARYFNRLRSI